MEPRLPQSIRCQFSLAVEEVRSAADWAFERGGYRITLTPKAGGPSLNEAGKYITIYQRQANASWKMARDIWNSDAAMVAGV